MKIHTSVFVSVFFACFWLKVNADCRFTHLGTISEKLIKTSEKVTDKCVEWECQDNGGWISTFCPKWWNGAEFVAYEPYDLSKKFPQCCGGPVSTIFFNQPAEAYPIFKENVAREKIFDRRSSNPEYHNSGANLSIISNLILSCILFLITR